jgi:hypothetical protein
MKHTPITYEQRRTYTIESATADFDKKNVAFNDGLYTLPDFYVRKALLSDTMFCLDCQCNGFPADVRLIPSNTADTFDVETIWTHSV